ncbi:MAG: peptide ABC transporter substrate-binding protein [Anaerolineae bacterium]|nr:peptide ABC transporter substrate-binding protein [Anaerolineae bacterium]MCO5204421.1 peptide ABC transporter substrate-binding protein [Anaerolineae bacterium]
MFNSKKGLLLVAMLVFVGVLLAACGGTAEPEVVEVTRVVVEEKEVIVEGTPEIQEVVVTQVVEVEVTQEVMAEKEPVTMYATSTTDIPSLDPQTGEDSVSIAYIKNLFAHLTAYDAETAEVVPEAATSWSVSDDGLVYTFNIRTDIPWVYHNPVTGETTQAMRPVTDDAGEVTGEEPAFVDAYDFVYGIKRACNPNTGSYYSSVVAPTIKGCEAVLNAEDPDNVPAELIDAIGVSAPDAETLIIELEFPAGFFLSMTPLWTLAATPEWVIDEYGEDWIEAGRIVTSGNYVLDEWVHGVRRTILRNPLMPEDMQGTGNIDRIITNEVPDSTTSYALWLNGEVEESAIPDAELQAHKENFADETDQVADLAVFYQGFRFDKPPFDDPNVRRAFSAALDREAFIEVVRQGEGLPMKHLAPPGIFGAVPIDEVGVGFNPEYAAERLAEAGYPNCEGFPQITLLGYSGASTLNWIEFVQANWAENLGCSPDLIQIEQLPFSELLDATASDDPAEAPHMWTLGWGPDYADQNNWVGDVLWCEGSNRQKRECDAVDEMIVDARTDPDPESRIAKYRAIEEALFGEEGTFPIMPIYLRIASQARHNWLDGTRSLFGGNQWYNWTIDQDTQLTARGQ